MGILSCMRIMDSAELLHREAREIAARSRRYTAALPGLDDEELRAARKAVLHAWIRYRYPISLQFVTNYVAIAATAMGMAVASSAAAVSPCLCHGHPVAARSGQRHR